MVNPVSLLLWWIIIGMLTLVFLGWAITRKDDENPADEVWREMSPKFNLPDEVNHDLFWVLVMIVFWPIFWVELIKNGGDL